jgi:hypothetical protein
MSNADAPETTGFRRWRASYSIHAPGGVVDIGGTTAVLDTPPPWPLREADFSSVQELLRSSPDLPPGHELTLLACQPLADHDDPKDSRP